MEFSASEKPVVMCEFIIIFNCMAARFDLCNSALNLNDLV